MLFIIVIIIIIICWVIFNKQNLQSTVKKSVIWLPHFQWRWSLEAEGRFFLFAVVEICVFGTSTVQETSAKQTSTDPCYFPLAPVNDCAYLVSLICILNNGGD